VTIRARFGEFLFDAETRELLRGSEAVHLSPKAFLLLQALLEKRPKAVAKEALYELLWARTFVEESNLKKLVSEIRDALGDTLPNPRLLRTVFGFGYAFSGEVELGPSALDTLGFYLVYRSREYELSTGDNVLGRERDSVIPLGLPGVSRRHARIAVGQSTATVHDLGSRNGTYVAGRRIQGPVELCEGDDIRLGAAVLVFHSAARSDTTESEKIR